MNTSTSQSRQRILSLDQFRGFTIFGMILVNFLGEFPSAPEALKHHTDYMTFADLIAPLFLFMVGMGFRLSLLRNQAQLGLVRTLAMAARRYALLTLIGIIYYDPLHWTQWWDALVDIGFAGLLALPLMFGNAFVRVAGAVVYMAVYQGLFTGAGYGSWTLANSFDGGPLGPLSWVFCLLLGTVAYDLIATRNARKIVLGCLVWGVLLCGAGYVLHIEWTGLKEFWPYSQRAMSSPYPVFATGLCFLAYVPFYLLSDRWRLQIPTFGVMGANPLVLYILHTAYLDLHSTIIPAESSLPAALTACLVFYLGCYAVARYLYRNGIFVKI